MKVKLLCLFLALYTAHLEELEDIENEMELLERLLGEEKMKPLLSAKEMEKARKETRKLEEHKPEPLNEEEIDENKYIYFENGQRELTNITCNRDYMQLFNLFGRKINYAYVTQISDHKFCFSDHSCCTDEHFSHMINNFSININRIRKRFRPMIELFSFFRGPALRHFIKANMDNPKCKYILYDNRKNSINLFDVDVFKQYSDLIVSFISQIKNFVALQEELFGNMLCSICAPKQQQYIKYDETRHKLIFEFSPDICNSVYRSESFELKVQYVYKYLVRRVADFIECASNLTMTGYSTARMIIYPKQQFHLNKDCYNNFNTDMPHCLKFCKDDLDVFKYDTYSHFTRHVRQTLKIFYHVLTSSGEEIEDYYKEVFGYGFHAGLEIQPIVIFSEKSPVALKYNIKEYEIDFNEKGGLNPNMSGISKSFWEEVSYIIEHSGKA